VIAAYLRGIGIQAQALDLNIRLIHMIAAERSYDLDRAGEVDYGQASLDLIGSLNDRLEQTVELDSSFYFKLDVDSDFLLAKSLELASDADDPFMQVFHRHFDPASNSVVGMSIHAESQLLSALAYAATIKRQYPGHMVVLGGAYVSQVYRQILSWPALFDLVDVCCIGEGEETMAALLRRERLGLIPNIIFRDSDGSLRRTHHSILQSLDILPVLEFSDYDQEFYPAVNGIGTLPYQTSRGCAYNRCAYCTYPIHEPGYRARSVSKVVSDIAHLKSQYGASFISFKDSLVVPSRMVDLCHAIMESDLNVHWKCATKVHPAITAPAMVRLLVDAGCRRIEFGVEHVNERIQTLIDKRQPRDLIDRTVLEFAGTGIELNINMMFGFPTETEEDALENYDFINWAKSLPDAKVKFSAHFVEINKRSPFHVRPFDYGIKELDDTGPGGNCTWKKPSWRTKPVWIERIQSV